MNDNGIIETIAASWQANEITHEEYKDLISLVFEMASDWRMHQQSSMERLDAVAAHLQRAPSELIAGVDTLLVEAVFSNWLEVWAKTCSEQGLDALQQANNHGLADWLVRTKRVATS